MNNYCYGIDVGGTTIKAGLFTTEGKLVEKYEIPTIKGDNGNIIFNDITSLIEGSIAKNNLHRENISGIGIGVPGAVQDNGVVNKCINIGLDVVNVSEVLSKRTGFAVKTGNDANMAALGEYWKGGASGYSSMAMLTLGTGIGGGIIINGNPVNGFNGAAAEVGHLPIALDAYDKGYLKKTDVCNCGKCGCAELVASATGVVRIAKKILAGDTFCKEHISELNTMADNMTAKDVFDAAKAGDVLALEVVDIVSRYLGITLACIAGITDVECFIIGGGMSKAGNTLIAKVTEYYRENVFYPSKNTPILGATLGNDAGIYGAAGLICMSN